MNLTWWYQWQCRRGRHQDVLFSVGHNPHKHCRHCKRPGILTPTNIAELRSQWPLWVQNPGGDDEVPLEQAKE